MNKKNKIGISFKKGEEYLYDFLSNQLSPSNYIKLLLIEQIEKQKKPKNNNNFDF